MSTVTVIVPSWNRRDLLAALFEHLSRQTHPIEEVIVVDNGSTDGSVELARQQGARVISMGYNAGFSAAVNRGIRENRSPWVVVINNDVEPAPDWLERLRAAADSPRASFATGKLIDANRRDIIDGTYDLLCRGACAWRAGHGRPDGPLWGKQRRIHSVPFTAALFRAALFEKVGLLDERFESYLEDVDFGLRCAKAGYSGLYVPGAVAWHAGSATLGRWHGDTVRRIARNQTYLVAKHYPRRYLLRYAWPLFVAQALWGVVALRHGRGLAYCRGKCEGLWKFRTLRREAKSKAGIHGGFSKALERGELEIFRLQQRTRFDPYWKAYFALTCGL